MIFDKRESLLPYEYPHLLKYKDAIRHSYWLHTEFNYTDDISDFKTKLSDVNRDIITKTMLAISQIEVSVKSFWGDIHKRMPKLEIHSVGATFNESEARHFDAYQSLLEKLNLQSQFETLMDVPQIKGRVKYLKKYLDGSRSKDDKLYTKSILLFSLFIEHVSLFSQFLIIMSFNKELNVLKGMSNVVEATSKEEDVHGNFGIEIIKIIKSEYPEWFDDDFEKLIYSACRKACQAEIELLDWIFEKGELNFLKKDTIIEFIKNRFNNSLSAIGYDRIFDIDHKVLESVKWFDVELKSKKENDFFYKRSIDYSKKTKSVNPEDLF